MGRLSRAFTGSAISASCCQRENQGPPPTSTAPELPALVQSRSGGPALPPAGHTRMRTCTHAGAAG
jgi:hypothetical protein